MASFNAPPNALTPYLESLELLKRLPTPPAPTHRLARRRPELTPHFRLVRIAVGTLHRRPHPHPLYAPSVGGRAPRRRGPAPHRAGGARELPGRARVRSRDDLHLGEHMTEMQIIARSHPGASW